MSLTDRYVLISGPTSGLGKQIALELGAMGARVILACRDLVKGEAVAAEVLAAGAAEAVVLPLDAASGVSIAALAAAYAKRFSRLDVLVNNAGLASGQRLLTGEGFELTFGTNVLGYHRLSLALLDLLKASAPARIVNVASAFAGDLDLDDLQFTRRPYDQLRAYAQSKACNRILTWALARRLEGTGVTANAMAPGFVPATGLARNLLPDLRREYGTRTGRSVADGADTAVWMASADDLGDLNGRFFSDRRELPCEFRGLETEERLWTLVSGARA